MENVMKIAANKIPAEGIKFVETASSEELDLNTDLIKFDGPIRLEAFVSKITNALTVNLDIYAKTVITCSRCLGEFSRDYHRNLKLNYPIEKTSTVVDLVPDIREEVILNYQINPLCSQDCKGLCPRCGRNLNEGGCSCATTKTKTL